MANPSGSQAQRRVFLSNPLKNDIRLSGTASADLGAALGGTATAANLSVTIVDLGAGTQTSRTSDGVTLDTTAACWGVGTVGDPCEGKALGAACTPTNDAIPAQQAIEDACYLNPVKPTQDVTSWRVTRGIRDSQNRDSLWFADAKPVAPGENFRVNFPTMPNEHVFKADHQIAIIVGGTNTSMVSGTEPAEQRARDAGRAHEQGHAADRRRPGRAAGRGRVHGRDRRRRWHRAVDPVADDRRAGLVRWPHPGCWADGRGLVDGDGDPTAATCS